MYEENRNTQRSDNLRGDNIHAGVLHTDDARHDRIVWWGAIVAGAIVAMSIQTLFALLGSTIGLGVMGASNDTPEKGISIGAGLWWLITGLISLYLGGWATGRLCRIRTPFIATMHGFLAWGIVTVFSALLVTVIGSATAGGMYAAFGNSLSVRNATPDYRNDASNYRNNTQSVSNDARTNASRANDQSMNANNSVNNPVSTDSPEAKEAAKRASVASLWMLVSLILGAVVTSMGGRVGATAQYKNEEVTRTGHAALAT